MSQIDIDLKSAAPSGVDAPGRQGVTRVRSAFKIRFATFMEPEIMADFIDLMAAKKALAESKEPQIPWEQARKDLGL